ncbi:MAG: DNA gyrase inhibitor YacG [Planctomycetia bacterium]|nr:DNA gyrase inhibitor YacG [Planctomycetia bacterium]
MAKVRCPICQQWFDEKSSSALPFCSERCRTIDLGRWLGEAYRVPGPETDEKAGAGAVEGPPPEAD